MEILDYPFMRMALLMGLVLGAFFALMGVFVVTRSMAFFSDFIAHSAILGAALAVLLNIEPTLFLIPFSLAMALMVAAIWNRLPLSRDTVLGVFYGAAVSAGVIIITLKGLGQQRLMGILFGDILLIRGMDIGLSIALFVVFAAFVMLRLRHLVKVSFFPEIAEAEGVSVKRYDAVLISLMAVTIALSIKIVGVVLANAMVVIPAAAAKAVSGNFRRFMMLAPAIGAFSFTAGIAGSFYLDLPSGPSVIAVAFGVFVIAAMFSRGRL